VTALSATPAAPVIAPRRARLGGLIWNAARLHRGMLVGLAAAFAASAAILIAIGLHAHANYAALLAHHCPGHWRAICYQFAAVPNFTPWLAIVPWLAAVFLGVPLTAREFETGAFRFSGTQAVAARRQLTCALLLLAAAVAVASTLLGLIAMWYQNPLLGTGFGDYSVWEFTYFQLTAVTLPAWAMLALGLGALAGAAVRRVLPALAAALVTLAIVFAWTWPTQATSSWPTVTHRLLAIAPVAARSTWPPWPRYESGSANPVGFWFPGGFADANGSLQVGGWLTGPGGHRLSGPAMRALAGQMPRPVQNRWDKLGRGWLAARHITYWIGIQPRNRFWIFQAILAGILLALAAAAGSGAVWLAGRRRRAGHS
jgi:hypothetical protein